MRKLAIGLAALGAVSCAEIDSVDSAPETLTVGRTIEIEADDGTTFEVSIVHDGGLTTLEESTILESIEVVGVRPVDTVDIVPVSSTPDYVPPADPDLVPGEYPVSVLVRGVDPDVLLGNYRWDWLEGIDQDQIEAFVEDLCPPWH